MATYLDRILASHRSAANNEERHFEDLRDQALAMPPTRGFRRRLASSEGLAVIAEIKRRSPSKGDLNPKLDPAQVAQEYATGGATALSVLTDEEFFGGSVADLAAAHAATTLPVLRKDFTVSTFDVCDARVMGADAVLLIAAALDDHELRDFMALANEIGLDALVEIHDEAELDRALAANATLVGVNQRDLVTFQVDTERAVRMAPLIPSDVVRVAESGVKGVVDATLLAEAGYDAVLVGETLVTATNHSAGVAALRQIPARAFAG